MSRITTEHNGYEITYGENSDTWSCWALQLEEKTLTKLKDRINKLLADARRISVPVIQVTNSWQRDAPMNAVMLDPDGKSVWCTYPEKQYARFTNRLIGEKTRRTKESFESLVLDTPDNRRLIEAWRSAVEETRRAQEREKAARDAIPRVTAESLKAEGTTSENAA